MLYMAGAATVALLPLVPKVGGRHEIALWAMAALAAAWGVCAYWAVNWRTAPIAIHHVATAAALALVALCVSASGGAASPAWAYLFFVVVFAAWFFDPAVAAVYVAGALAIQALPFAYDGRALHGRFIAELWIAATAYIALAVAISTGKQLLGRLHDQATRLAAEQSALRRLATAVAASAPAETIYQLVAQELAGLLDARASGILRLESPDEAVVMGSWSATPHGRYQPGTRVPVRPGSDVQQAILTQRPVRVRRHQPGSPVVRLGYETSVVGPVHVDSGVWGILAVTADHEADLPPDTEERLTEFAGLLTTAISSIEDRAKLARQATTDPLTGLLNHGALYDRLAVEVARAGRHGRSVSVAVIDVDHFKEINDLAGHEAGDRVLVRLADALRELARTEDILGRVGGDEFAWILPECGALQAMAAVERARTFIAAAPLSPRPLTISAGICELSQAKDASQLMQLADGALYWSKAHGRNVCWVYNPEVVQELSAHERAEHLERSRALVGVRALARAIDAKDPLTRRHSERVSDLVAELARMRGWPPERSRLLAEAALVHDVGKLGVPDAVLLKDGSLTDDEYVQVRQHAELSARIVDDVLSPEQVEWIRSHHERPDGLGYPRSLGAEQIPEGAALLAIADAWDVMTLSRPYSRPKPAAEAIDECRRLAGAQFSADAVAALEQLYEAGDLEVPEAELLADRGQTAAG